MTSQNAFLNKYSKKSQNEYQDDEFSSLIEQNSGFFDKSSINRLRCINAFLSLVYEHNILLPPMISKKCIFDTIVLNENINDISHKLDNIIASGKHPDNVNLMIEAVNKIIETFSNLPRIQDFLIMEYRTLEELNDKGVTNLMYSYLASEMYYKYKEDNIIILPELKNLTNFHEEYWMDIFNDKNIKDHKDLIALYLFISNLGSLRLIENSDVLFQEDLLSLFEDIRGCGSSSDSLSDSYILNKNIFIPILNIILEEAVAIINDELELNVDLKLDDIFQMSEDEFNGLRDIWGNIIKERCESGEYAIIQSDMTQLDIIISFALLSAKKKDENSYEEDEIEEYQEPQADNKASAAILKFFDSNSNTLVAKLKESGLQLSAAALQNDQNIARVANVVYNLLPGMVRIFVSYDTVENFLLNNRQWLINKLV